MIKKNEEIASQIRRADFQGKSKEEIKPLYAELNSFDIELDRPIFRIFQLNYLKQDIGNNQLTHIKASPKTWGDPFENPLLNFEYIDKPNSEPYTLNGIVGNLFALSWTKDNIEKKDRWDDFSHGQPSVRIKTTPRRLLERVMHIEDTYFMLHHYIGGVQYLSGKNIKKWRRNTPVVEHLDSLGQGIVLSLMALRTKFSDEEEIRLVYTHIPNDAMPWISTNVQFVGDLCKHPFSWKEIIDEIIVGPNVPDGGEKEIREFMSAHGIVCHIKNSIFRTAKD